jgi:NitT/TauT family transport system substrate-binding protein
LQHLRSRIRPHRAFPALVVALAVLTAACAPTATAPTAPPAKPTEAPKPAATAPAAAAKPTEAAKPGATVPAAAAKPTEAAKPGAAPAATAAAPKPTGQQITLPKPEKTSVKLTHSTIETNQVVYVLAKDLGLYKKYGFDDVELFYNEGDAKSFQAIVSGQLDFTAQGASVAVSSLLTDTPLVTVAFTATTLTDDLVAAKDVKSAADLKGKPVAVSSFGGTSHASVLLSLKALGLTANDVTIQQVGGQAARVAALTAGSVAAAPIDAAQQTEMKAQGFNILVHLQDTPAEFARNGLMVRRDFLEKNPNTVLAFTAANLEAMQAVFTQTDKAIESYMNWSQQRDRARAESDIKDFMSYARRDMAWSQAAFDSAKEVLISTNPEIATVDVTKGYSLEYLKKLADMGFYESVGAPKPKF